MGRILISVCLVVLICTLDIQGKKLKRNGQKARLTQKRAGFSCNDGSTISQYWVCDRMDDCADGEDEAGCPGQFACGNGRYVFTSWLCDGDEDCSNGSDEQGCATPPATSPAPAVSDSFTCNDGNVITGSWVCDRMDDCDGGEDEANCPAQFACGNGYYVYNSWVCDNEEDCSNGRDEEGCDGTSGTGVTGGTNGTGSSGNANSCTQRVESVHASSTADIPVVPECGRRGPSAASTRSDKLRRLLKKAGLEIPERIVGGQASTSGQWPWLVGISDSSGKPFCGGTLISSDWVLTASHCITPGERVCDYKILLGEHNLSQNNEPDFQNVAAERVLMHAGYDSVEIDNDIALIKLSRSFVLSNSQYISAACLPEDNYNMMGKSCYVAGWGIEAYGASQLSNVVQHIQTPALNDTVCKDAYGASTIKPGMFCAGSLEGDKDSCQGDSGGPLVCDDGDGTFTLGGVVSWGYGCATKDYPGVYTRVSDFMPWIEATIAQYNN